MKRDQSISVKRDGTKVIITRNIKDVVSFKEYLDTLNQMNGERIRMRNQIESLKGGMEKGDVDRKKLVKFQKEVEDILRISIINDVKELKKNKEYLEQSDDQKNAWLFSRKDLMDKAPEHILRSVIWNEGKNEADDKKKGSV